MNRFIYIRKRLWTSLLLSLFFYHIGIAQTQTCGYFSAPDTSGWNIPSAPDPCDESLIRTDPYAPLNTQNWQRANTFNWIDPDPDPVSFWEEYCINSPDIQTDYIKTPWSQDDNSVTNHFLDNQDKYPKDGWELIKYDFGYTQTGQPAGTGVNYPYLVLYNRFTGRLRVFIAISKTDYPFQVAEIRLRHQSGTMPSNLDLSTAFTGTQDGITSLKDFIQFPEFVSGSRYLDETGRWLYADFNLMYDPCVCHYDSKMRIELKLISTAEITMTSTTTGSLVPDQDILNSGTSTYEDGEGQHTWGWKDIAGFNEKAVQKSTKAYKDLNDFKKSANDAIDKSGLSAAEKQKKKGEVDDLKTALGLTGFLKEGLQALPYASAALTFLDFFVGGGEKDPSPQEVKLIPMAIELNSRYKGTISQSLEKRNITFSTPGGSNVNPTDLDYPLYNEPLGIFHLYETPELSYKTTYTGSPAFTPTTYGPVYLVDPDDDPTWESWDPYDPHALLDPADFYAVDPFLHQPFGASEDDPVRSYVYKLDQDVAYFVNEAAEFTDRSEVLAAIWIEVSSGDTPAGVGYLRGTNFNLFSEGKGIYRTQYLPLSCINGLTAEFTTSDYNLVKVYLKVVANFERGDSYIVPNETQNILWSGKFALKTTLVSGEYNFTSSFIGIPREVVITQSGVLTQDISAFERVTINPGVSLSSSVPVTIRAGEEVIISPGATISPNITFEIAQPNACSDYYAPTAKGDVAAFCQSSIYQENRQLRLRAPDEHSVMAEEKESNYIFSLTAHPNPFDETLTLRYELPEAAQVAIVLLDLMGRPVMQVQQAQAMQAGPQEVVVDASGLAAGMYHAVLQANSRRESVKVVKQ